MANETKTEAPRVRYVTRGAIRREKVTIPAGTAIKPEDLPEGDFERMVGEGVIVLDTGRK